MSMDLIISDKGDILIASNIPFPSEVTRVEFHADKKLLLLNYAGKSPDGELLNMEVHPRMMTALMKAPSALVVYMKDEIPQDGYEVPVVQADILRA